MTFNIKDFMPDDEGVSPSTYMPPHKKYHDREKAYGTVQVVFKCSQEFKDFLYWYKKIHGFANLYECFRWLFWQSGLQFIKPYEIPPFNGVSKEDVEEENRKKKIVRDKRNKIKKQMKNQSPIKDSDKD